ncbi:unnamed protein product [Symbiodinium sp. CCMP2592]|nr:unnamed protein product [Symbiodinium sp. CCMP2592]
MEIDKRVADEAAPMSVEPERGFTSAGEELGAPKLAKVVNAVLIEKNTENTAFPEPVQMCGSKVWLAKMKSALSELDGCPLDVSSAMEGRRTKLGSMDSHKAGRIVSADEAHAFAKKHGIRIIPTRWVLGPKVVNGKDAVRARCVVQDVAKGSAASSLGLSATTPSLEALRTLLAIAAKDSMDIATLDVSTAFLHSPLPKGEKAVIMLPRDVSSRSDYYAPAYMILDQAMNGLRVAAKAWNLKLANVVKKVGLNQRPTEPSVFEGTVKGKRFLMLCYVDDLILCGSSDAIKLVTDTLNRELKIKETGDGGKGDGANQGESPMAKAVPRPDGPPSVVTLFPELNGSEMPTWYTELWEKMGVRGAPLDQMDLQPLVESLSGEDLEFYKKSFESQYGGKSVIWETAMNGGCIYVEMSPGLSGLAVLMFVQYLKRKGFLVLILLSRHQDQGILRMLDLLYTLPILGVERYTKDDLETTSHPPWVCRWKEHAQKGNVVFATMLSKVCWMSDLTCQTIKIFDPKMKDLGKPLPLWAYFAYTNNDVVKESLSVDCDHMAVKLPTGVLESIREPVIWQCDCAWHVASDYASRFNTNLPCILWEHIWKFLGGNTQKLGDVELRVEQAVLAAVAAHDLEVEAEKKRKRREKLDAAEEEAAKKARLEQPSPSSPPAMIAQIAEMVKASLSVGDLEKLLDEKKRASASGSAQGSESSGLALLSRISRCAKGLLSWSR